MSKQQMSIEIKTLENYVLSREKEQVLNEVTPYSEVYYYLELINLLNKTDNPKSLESKINTFIHNSTFSQQRRNTIEAKFLLSSLAKSTNEAENKKILEQINQKFLHLTHQHQKPSKIETGNNLFTQEEKLDSKLKKDQLKNLDQVLNEFYVYNDFQHLDQIAEEYYYLLDFTKIKTDNQEINDRILKKLKFINLDKGFVRYFEKIIEIQDNNYYNIDFQSILQQLSFEDHKRILSHKQFNTNSSLFLQLYLRNNNFEEINWDDKIEIIKNQTLERINFLENSPQVFKINISILRKNLLGFYHSKKLVDEDLFLTYLKNPFEQDIQQLNQQYQTQQYSKNEQLFGRDRQSNIFIQSKFGYSLLEILEQIFYNQKEISLEAYKPYFVLEQLEKLMFKVKFERGEEIQNINKYFSDSELKNMNDKKILEISGQKIFQKNDKIEIKLKIKNIKNLRVRIFEINLEAYLLQKQGQFDNNYDVNVDCLIPSEEYNYSFTQAPILLHEEKLEFPSIQSREKGVFIIDIIGEEMNAKAIIKKGNLVLIYDRVCGRNCVIIDEDNKLCKSEKTGFYIENKFFKANEETGIISLPKDIQIYEQKQVVLVHKEFADIGKLSTKEIKYELQMQFLLNPEEIIPGRSAKLVVAIYLLLNGRKQSLKQLKEVVIKIIAIKENGITQQKILKDLDLKDDEDLVIDYLVPAKMNQLTFNLEAEVDKKKLNVVQNQEFRRTRLQKQNDLALKQNEQGEYILEFFGQNGEPLIKQMQQIEFIYRNLTQSTLLSFQTDEQGRIYLEKLEEVSEIRIQGLIFQINSKQQIIQQEINGIEGEIIIIKNPQNLKVLRFQSKNPSKESLKENATQEDRQIKIKNLKKGQYFLELENTFYFFINIHKGSVFEMNGLNILKENEILTLEEQKYGFGAYIAQENQNQLKIKFTGLQEQTKCHLIFSNYQLKESEILRLGYPINTQAQQSFYIKRKDCIYKSNGKLHDELVYVHNRKNKKNYIGNTLEKPGTILKRQKVKETVEQEEQIREALLCHDAINQCLECSGEMNLNNQMDNFEQKILTLREFLNTNEEQKQMLIPNLKIENQEIKIDSKMKNYYSNLYLVGYNENGNFCLNISHQDLKIEKNDLRSFTNREKGNIFSFDRSMNHLKPKIECKIPHFSKQEVSFIETTKDLFEVLQLLSNSLNEWDFIGNWESLSSEEKLKKYDKFCSHELNLFLYVKDEEFFQGVVQPFIKNKKEKTLTDYFLLNDQQNLDKFRIISNTVNLNVLEQILLYKSSLDNNPLFAEALFNKLKLQSSLQLIDIANYKKQFDSILSSKQTESEEPVMLGQSISNTIPTFYGGGGAMNCKPVSKSRGFCGGMKKAQRQQNIAPPPPPMFSNQDKDIFGGEKRGMMLDQVDLDEMYQNQQQQQQIQLFKPLQGTVEYEERQYYSQQTPSNTINKFWFDLIEHLNKFKTFKNFFSKNFTEISVKGILPENLAILTFIDLPFTKKDFKSSLKNDDFLLIPETPLICLTKEIIEQKGTKVDHNIMVNQKFFDPLDRYTYSEENPDMQFEKIVKEMIKQVNYEGRIVVTNSSTTPQKVDLIYEIPDGSIILGDFNSMNLKSLVLNPLESKSFNFEFYFPQTGKFHVYPATVVSNNEILAIAEIDEQIEVKDKKTIQELNTLSDILSGGNVEDILKFIETKNLFNINLFNFNDIYWLLRNEKIYKQIIQILQKKGVYDDTVWSYSILHSDIQTFSEFFKTQNLQNTFNDFLPYFQSNKFSLDNFKLYEYYPLVNPRTYSLQSTQGNILNEQFKNTYIKFLEYLIHKNQLNEIDKIIFINYLICQDRIEEALHLHQEINRENLQENQTIIQYDYLTAYLDFINGYPKFEIAKKICQNYLTYPILTWRNLFVEIANQLAEFEETDLVEKIIKEEKDKSNLEKAKAQTSITCEIVDSKIKIIYENLKSFVIKLYKVDLEAYFSLNSFKTTSIQDYTNVIPFYQQEVEIDQNSNQNQTFYQLPEKISKENLFIEISSQKDGIGISQYLEYIPFSLNYHLNKEFGILKVFDLISKKPVPKIYMKCFAQYQNGAIKFYKDGYSDLRGSFDYVSLNKDKLDDIKKYKIFINAPGYGCKIIEAEPPKKIGRIEGEAKKIISKNWRDVQQKQADQGMNKYTKLLL